MQKINFREIVFGSKENYEAIKSNKFLIVGAGGIGSEILKSISKIGAIHITILDYDRLEVINLNRGFMNGSEYARKGVYKVEALKTEFKRVCPSLEIVSLPKNIFDYDANFISQFDIIFCAVDSIKARQHLSKICVLAKKPMFDGGVHELYGQSKTQIAGETECYGCQSGFFIDEPMPCSIRTIPQYDMHAVLWAKFILGSIMEKFKNQRDEDLGVNFTDFKEMENEYAVKLFDFLFHKIVSELENSSELRDLKPITFSDAKMLTETIKKENIIYHNDILPNQKLLSISQYANKFVENINELFSKYQILDSSDYKNSLILDLITNLTNLRIYNFRETSRLNHMSKFDIERTLLNITPVIATSASIIAGLLVTEAIKFITNQKPLLTTVWLTQESDRLNPTENSPADPDCLICGSSQIYKSTHIDQTITLKEFLDKNNIASYLEKMQIILENVVYDSDDDTEELKLIYEQNLQTSLASLAKRILNKPDIEHFSLMIYLLESEKTLNYEIEIENRTKS